MDKYTILKKYFGYDSFRAGQETLIDAVLAGRDALGVMPTGAGKSLCYQIPALLLPGITLVISPLISLMKDQVQSLNQAGIHAAYINSSLTENQITKALALAAQGQYKIIYVAPERLETYGFLQFARRVTISMLTVDEAHCISQWGQDFRTSYLNIMQFLERLAYRPVVSAFTATATDRVREDIIHVLGLREPTLLTTGFDRANLYFSVETPRKKDSFVQNYIKEHAGESGIVYCATRKNVDELFLQLDAAGISVARYHAGLGSEERRRSQEAFIYDACQVMVATNAFGMGIDKSNVRYVLHYNMPQSMENYYQEAGRAGRDGEPAECILLYSAHDLMIDRFLIDNKEQNPQMTAEENAKLRERDEERLRVMNHYCLTTQCLRSYILDYFGENTQADCQNCGNCKKEFEELDVTKEAEQIIRCVEEMHQRYGINVVAGTLHGDGRAKLMEYGVSKYSAYGSLSGMGEAGIKEIIRELLLAGLLTQTNDKYAILKLTDASGDVLSGGRSVLLRREKHAPVQQTGAGTHKARRSDILNTKGMELFEQLRSLRAQLASGAGVPPYIIFSDRTLVDMCVKTPLDREEMLQVSGVGENKYARYGEQFLTAISSFTGGVHKKLHFGEGAETPAGDTGTGWTKTAPKSAFFLTKEQAAGVSYTQQCLVTELAAALNSRRDADTVKKLSGAEIFRQVQAKGLATERVTDGKHRKTVTQAGEQAGLYIGMRQSKKGTEYEDVYYKETAQRMIAGWFTRNLAFKF